MSDSGEVIVQKRKRKNFLEHLLGPFGSILFHILLVYAALRFMGIVGEEKTANITVQIMEADAIDLEEFEKELQEMQELQEMNDLVAPPDQAFDVAAPPDVNTDVSPTEDISMDLADLNVLSDAQSPLVMKGLFEGRSGEGRSRMLGAAGRWGKETEQAVVKALEWLKNNQQEDGSWKPNSMDDNSRRMEIGITGVCLLAFLAHGETPSSEKYGPTVEKAIRFLVGRQAESGHFLDIVDAQDATYIAGAYGQAIATYAISESYALTRIPSLKPVMEKAVNVLLQGQQDRGAWYYRYDKGDTGNSSVTGWHMQALKAAHLAGAENPGIKEAMTKAVDFIKSQQDNDGLFYYKQKLDGRKDEGITAAATLALQLLGHAKSQEARKGMQALGSASLDWDKPPPFPMSVWYYITQVKFHQGGQEWRSWNETFARAYTRSQNEDGSWTSPASEGSGIPFGHEYAFGPAFSTAMSALTLQVYYRFLPTYKPIEVEEEKEPAVKDVVIEII